MSAKRKVKKPAVKKSSGKSAGKAATKKATKKAPARKSAGSLSSKKAMTKTATTKRSAAKKSATKKATKKSAVSLSPSAKKAARAGLRRARPGVADVLTEALPYLRSYVGKPIVVKVSGQVAENESLLADFASDLVLARQVGVRPVLVHGGAPQIEAQLEREGYESRFRDGLRVTDGEVARVVEMVLSGQVNKRIVSAIEAAGGRAMGLSGRDGGLITARRAGGGLGLVGEVVSVQIHPILAIEQAGMIPVVAPVGGAGGEVLNINADTVAGAVAGALGAVRLLIATDVEGLMDSGGDVVGELSLGAARRLLGARSTGGGMRPKLSACIAAVEGGVEAAVMLDGRVPHALLLELFTTHGGGTIIRHK